SSVVVEVTGRLDYGTGLAIEKQLRQLANRLQTANLASEVARRYQFDLSRERLLEKIHTQAFPDTITIQIDVDDTDPNRATRIAPGFAEVFVEREMASQEGLPTQERRTVSQLDDPKEPHLYWPQPRVFALSGLILGLVLGLLLAFAREYLDDSLKTSDDVERYLGLATLGAIPSVPSGARGPALGPSGGQSSSALPRPLQPAHQAAPVEEAGAAGGRRGAMTNE